MQDLNRTSQNRHKPKNPAPFLPPFLPAPFLPARAAARRRFGNPARLREESHDLYSLRLLEGVGRDLRLAARMLRKSPGFTAMAVFSLAVGIGAISAIFSLIDSIILRSDLALVERPSELVDLFAVVDRWSAAPLNFAEVEDLREATAEVFSGFAESYFDVVQVDRAGGIESVFAETVTEDYFSTL